MCKLIYIACLPAMLLWISCTKKIPDYGVTSTVKMSNGWWVTYYVGGVAQNSTPLFFNTYNTAGNQDSIWVDDLTKGFGFKCKAKIDYTNMTFSIVNSPNEYAPDSLTITEGKILAKAGHSKAGNLTDSIFLKAVFSDDPAHDVITVAGTARTGFDEDDY